MSLGVVITLAAIVLGFRGTAALSPLLSLPAFTVPSFALWLVGLAAGAFLTFAWLWPVDYYEPVERFPSSLTFIVTVVIFGALMIVSATLGPEPLPPVRAALAFLFGTLALRAGLLTLGLLRQGGAIQFDSNWGGLGGGMGGWRISPTAAFAALAVIFASTTLAVALVGTPGDGTKAPNSAGAGRVSNSAQVHEAVPPTADGDAARPSAGNEAAVQGNQAGALSNSGAPQ